MSPYDSHREFIAQTEFCGRGKHTKLCAFLIPGPTNFPPHSPWKQTWGGSCSSKPPVPHSLVHTPDQRIPMPWTANESRHTRQARKKDCFLLFLNPLASAFTVPAGKDEDPSAGICLSIPWPLGFKSREITACRVNQVLRKIATLFWAQGIIPAHFPRLLWGEQSGTSRPFPQAYQRCEASHGVGN